MSATQSVSSPRPKQRPLDWAVLPAGCYTGLEVQPDPSRTIARLGRLCAGHMQPLAPVTVVRASNGSADFTFELAAAPSCIRVLAASTDAPRMTLQLKTPQGATEASAFLDAPFAVLATDGPICVAESGTYRVTATAETQHAIALQAFSGTDEQ